MTKKIHWLIIGIALVLFSVPFFWLKPGFVDLGGDGGRLYFIDPIGSIKSTVSYISSIYPYEFSYIPYYFSLFVLKLIIKTPTNLIGFEHGTQLSLSFLGIYLILRELIRNTERKGSEEFLALVGIVTGTVYIAFIIKVGWPVALMTLNQTFLNVVMFYFLLKYCLTRKLWYPIAGLWLSIIFSSNFGLQDLPQLLSFYPFALAFLYIYISKVLKRTVPWKGLGAFFLLFLGIHMFDMLPVLASLIAKTGLIHSAVFSSNAINVTGVNYFVANHADSGKLSKELFQWWISKRYVALIIPLIAVAGFFKSTSKLLALLGAFFAITFFLVTANITNAGVAFYTLLFHLPGFVMFRSFNEKWHFVNAFFFTLLFGLSFYYLFVKQKPRVWLTVGCIIMAILLFRLYPFLRGDTLHSTLWLSNNVPAVFSIDPNLTEEVSFAKTLPQDGKVLTLPLTFPYYQIAFGKEGGAYEGISMIYNFTGRQEFPGFWSFGPYESPIFGAFLRSDIPRLTQLFSLLNIRYIFRNTDPRAMNEFPIYPYLDSGAYAKKDQFPLLADEQGYDKFMQLLPVNKIFEHGFYRIYEVQDSYVRPLIYIPDMVYSDQDKGPSDKYRWAFADKDACVVMRCGVSDSKIPTTSYVERTQVAFDVTVNLQGRKDPFLLIMSDPYNASVELSLREGAKSGATKHVLVNGYANGWIIDPSRLDNVTTLHGSIYLSTQNYLYIGTVVSGVSLFILVIFSGLQLIRRKHEDD